MNCKPGDLAIIYRTGPKTKGALGRIVRLIERGPDREYGDLVKRPRWVYAPPLIKNDDTGAPITWVNDCCLKPLPDENEQTDITSTRELESA